jgi:hypothetical protein
MAKKRDYVRDEFGRFAPSGDSNNKKSSGGGSGGGRGGGIPRASRGKRSTQEKIALSATDITSSHLRRSSNPHVRAVGVALSAAGSLARNRALRSTLRNARK